MTEKLEVICNPKGTPTHSITIECVTCRTETHYCKDHPRCYDSRECDYKAIGIGCMQQYCTYNNKEMKT